MNIKASSHILRVILIVAFGFAGTPVRTARAAGTRRYARVGGATSGSCDSWSAACDLYFLLHSVAVSGDQVWVQEGVYRPAASDRAKSFELHDGVAIYGGFVGSETKLGQRKPATNTTVLSGDIGTLGVATDNSYNVVSGTSVGSHTILDGFTITGGYGVDGGIGFNIGGGIILYTVSVPVLRNLIITGNQSLYGGGIGDHDSSAPTLTNVKIEGNLAGTAGGGMYNVDGAPKLNKVTFAANDAGSNGGGLFNADGSPVLSHVAFGGNWAGSTGGGFQNGTGSPKLTGVTFNGNLAGDQGGGFFTFGGTPALSKVVFQGNTAVNYGGGMWSKGGPPTLTDVTFNHNQAVVYGGGGLFSQDTGVTLSRVTFSGNTAGWGGGMYNNGGSNSSLTNVTFNGNTVSVYGGAMFNQVNSNPALKNVTISGNSGIGGAIYNDASHPTVISSIIWGNSGPEISNASGGAFTISHSILKGGCPAADPSFSCGHQILNTNPKLGPLASNGGFTKTMALALGSPAIDSLACLAAAKTDQRGVARPQGPMCDMGAYERVP